MAPAAHAYKRFDFDQRYLIQPGFILKDHNVVKADDDSFHIFYIKADESVPEINRAKSLGHATSIDMVHWNFRPDVVPVGAVGSWEESFIWAPHVVRQSNVYFMYYTGVNRNYAQATGLATSTDLYHWTKNAANPVYKPSVSWASWNSATWSNCRDPYVFQDGNTWYMLNTAWTNTSKGAISFASSSDLVHWTDLGPLFVHPGPKAWHVLESTNLIKYGGAYHLFMTEQDIGGSTYIKSATLTGPWDYTSRQPFDDGAAVEVYSVGGQWMLSRHTTFTANNTVRYTIKFDNLDWNTASKPIVAWTDPMSSWKIYSGDAFYLQPTFWDNPAARGMSPCNFGGNSFIGTYELFTGPLQVGYPGLAAGDEPVGIIRSPTFTLTGNRISFRIGGGRDITKLYLALYTADDNFLRVRATGNNSEIMSPITWDLSAWVGRPVLLEIADLSSAQWGHVNVDEIVEFFSNVPVTDAADVPRVLALHQNVPNPFNPSTTIGFEVPAAGRAQLAVYDPRGRVVRTLVDTRLQPGPYKMLWDGRDANGGRMASGVYFYRLQVGDRAPLTRRMMLVK